MARDSAARIASPTRISRNMDRMAENRTTHWYIQQRGRTLYSRPSDPRELARQRGFIMRRICAFISSILVASCAHAAGFQKIILDGDHDAVSGGTMTIFATVVNGGNLFLTTHLSGAGITTANDTAWFYGPATSLSP